MAAGTIGGAFATINNAIMAPLFRRMSLCAVSASPSKAVLPSTVTFLNNGVGSTKIADVDANFATQVTAYNPNGLVIMSGVNDLVNQTALAAYRASWDSIMTKANAIGVRVWAMEIFGHMERWASNPLRWAGAYDPPTVLMTPDQYNAEGRASVEARGGTWVPVRAAALLLEPTGNPTSADNGYLLADSIHYLPPAGFAFASAQFLSTVTLIP